MSSQHETAIAEVIHNLRTRLGLTQEKFAARLGVTFPTINRWENGRTRPSPLALKQIEALMRELDSAEGQSNAPASEPNPPAHA